MLENTQTIEQFMGSFGIVPMKTAKDEGLLSFQNCKDRILQLIQLNIQNFKNNAWSLENRMNKLLVDLDPKRNKSVLTVRVGGKRVYRCNTHMLTPTEKVEFLTKFYQGVSTGCLDREIEDFCEGQVRLAEARKKKQRETRKEQRRLEREAYLQKEANAMKHLPKNV